MSLWSKLGACILGRRRTLLKGVQRILFLDSSEVEQTAVNRWVRGSIPRRGAIVSWMRGLYHFPAKKEIQETGSVGSNPTLTASFVTAGIPHFYQR